MCYAVHRKSIFFLKIHHLFTLTLFLTCRTSSFWQKFDLCKKKNGLYKYNKTVQPYVKQFDVPYMNICKNIFSSHKAIIRFQMPNGICGMNYCYSVFIMVIFGAGHKKKKKNIYIYIYIVYIFHRDLEQFCMLFYVDITVTLLRDVRAKILFCQWEHI